MHAEATDAGGISQLVNLFGWAAPRVIEAVDVFRVVNLNSQ